MVLTKRDQTDDILIIGVEAQKLERFTEEILEKRGILDKSLKGKAKDIVCKWF